MGESHWVWLMVSPAIAKIQPADETHKSKGERHPEGNQFGPCHTSRIIQEVPQASSFEK